HLGAAPASQLEVEIVVFRREGMVKSAGEFKVLVALGIVAHAIVVAANATGGVARDTRDGRRVQEVPVAVVHAPAGLGGVAELVVEPRLADARERLRILRRVL